MESALIGRHATSLAKPEQLLPVRNTNPNPNRNRNPNPVRRSSYVSIPSANRKRIPISLKAVVSSEIGGEKKRDNGPVPPVTPVPARLFVGLPVDSVSGCNAVKYGKAISAGLRALKLLGVHGVDLPVWWSVVEPAESTFDWSAYLAVAQLVRDSGLMLRISLNLYGSGKGQRLGFGLPEWVGRIAEEDPDILFTDRSGTRRKDCLSFAVDDLPVLGGKTPMEAFEDFFSSFADAFQEHIGTTLTDVSVGLGPNGELRYPSFPPATSNGPFSGVGEFQCYDKYILAKLKKHAEETGNHYWGLSGPHDAPGYNHSPNTTNFFKDNGGSWETPYGNFFLSWYSSQLHAHGDRLLSLASKIFGNSPLTLSAKIPLLHYWHSTRSHPSELTAGYYNSDGKDGYDSVVAMFARNSCQMVVPGMDLSDHDQPVGLGSSPESLLAQIAKACERHGVTMSGETCLLSRNGFSKVKENLPVVDSYTYQRMGAEFFSPEHWPLFTEFVRSLTEVELGVDDLASKEGEGMSMPIGTTVIGKDRQMQAV